MGRAVGDKIRPLPNGRSAVGNGWTEQSHKCRGVGGVRPMYATPPRMFSKDGDTAATKVGMAQATKRPCRKVFEPPQITFIHTSLITLMSLLLE